MSPKPRHHRYMTVTVISDRRTVTGRTRIDSVISGPFRAPANAENTVEHTPQYDRYIDVFDTKDEAYAFIHENHV